MKNRILKTLVLPLLLVLSAPGMGQPISGGVVPTNNGNLVVHALNHATFALSWDNKTLYIDPVGGAPVFDGLPRPDMILVTDIHGDHLDPGTISALGGDAPIIAPDAVIDQLGEDLASRAISLGNGDQMQREGIIIQAIPMYNLTEERLQYHAKGRGNGYVLTFGDTRVYISGDTEDIPEMRALEDIDVAFVCFNLPYTMTEAQAASAINEFRPRIVYPYHYRGSDLQLFTSMVDDGIEVRQAPWY